MNAQHGDIPAQTAPAAGAPDWELTLYVSGASDLSGRAITDATRHCEAHLPGRYVLFVVDVHEDPEAVRRDDILAAPTLVRARPLPARRIVGDLSQGDRVRAALDLPPPDQGAAAGEGVGA